MLEERESSVNGGFPQLQSCGESSEEELSVLPRHTKVVVTGNNRTKSVLVGLQGVVKKAVGLGGKVEFETTHCSAKLSIFEDLMIYYLKITLVLTNGIEVKLQRNALSVIEAPTGNEEDDNLECENMQWNGSDMGEFDELSTFSYMFMPVISTRQSCVPYPRLMIPKSTTGQGIGHIKQWDQLTKLQAGPIHLTHSLKGPSLLSGKVDLSKLETTALWRYWRYFNLVDAIPNPSKEQLIDAVQRHFMSQFPYHERRKEPNPILCLQCNCFSFLSHEATGRVAGYRRICAGCEETENHLQLSAHGGGCAFRANRLVFGNLSFDVCSNRL
ncbi:hypothetical protein ACLOJK_002877 [Asimina triloba]